MEKKITNVSPLTPIQKGILYEYLQNKKKDNYITNILMDISGNFDYATFKEVFIDMIKKYEILRSLVIYEGTKEPVQIVVDNIEPNLFYHESFEDKNTQEFIDNIILNTRFDISKFNPVRVYIINIKNNKYKMLWQCHHILSDGWGLSILIKDFVEIYNNKKNGICISNEIVKLGNYAKQIASLDMSKGRNYWKDYLSGYSKAINLAKEVKATTEEKEIYTFSFDRDLSYKLRKVASENQLSLNSVIASIWSIVLQRSTYCNDIVFGNVVSGRNIKIDNIENIPNICINTLPLRINVYEGSRFIEIAKRVKEDVLNAEEYSYCSLVEIQKESKTGNKLINCIFSFENYPLSGGLKKLMDKVNLDFNIDDVKFYENFDYELGLVINPLEKIDFKFVYEKAKYCREWFVNIEKDFHIIAKQIIDNLNIRIKDINIIDYDQLQSKYTEIVNFNNKNFYYDTIYTRFNTVSNKYNNKTAIIHNEEKITYDKLRDRAERLSKILIINGIQKGDTVGITINKSIDAIVAMLSIVKIGANYMFINMEYPIDRINYFIQKANCKYIVYDKQPRGLKSFVKNIYINSELNDNEPTEQYIEEDSNEVAYTMFTSGTTGQPKGVKIPHRGIIRLIDDKKYIDINSNDIVSQTSPMDFDASTLEVWGALLNGASLVIIDKEILLNTEKFQSFLKFNNISFLWLTAPLLNSLVNENTIDFSKVKKLIAGGDVVDYNVTNKIRRENKGIRIINGYGPTENTTFTTCFEIKEDFNCNIPIGSCIKDTFYIIINNNNELQKDGFYGELLVTGSGLALGYINGGEDKFVTNIKGFEGIKFYKTGDLVRLINNQLEFITRIDDQVKINGFRIELKEIEYVVRSNSKIKEAIAITKMVNGAKRICLFYSLRENLDKSELKAYLSTKLPSYMMPNYYREVENFKLKINGKIDSEYLETLSLYELENKVNKQPETITENLVLNIWKEVIKAEELSIEDNFFEVGGHSLNMMSIISRIRYESKVNVSFSEFTENCTIAKLAELIDRKIRSNEFLKDSTEALIDPDQDSPFPLTEIQQSYFVGRKAIYELGGGSTHAFVELNFYKDIFRLKETFEKILRRHPMLRAKILSNGTQQIINEIPKEFFAIHDISNNDNQEKEILLAEVKKRMAANSFDLSQWPLLKIEAYQVTDLDYKIFIEYDPIIIDGSSISILLKELKYYYFNDEELEPIKFTFKDYVQNYKLLKESNKYDSSKEYWLNKIESIPDCPRLPFVSNPKSIKNPSFRRIKTLIEKEKWQGIKELIKSKGVTVAATICTVYAKILAYSSNQQSLSINLTLFNRNNFHKDVNNIVGDFTSLIILDINLNEDDFWNQVRNVQTNLLKAFDNKLFDGVDIIRELGKRKIDKTQAIMPIVFTFMVSENEISDFELKNQLWEVVDGLNKTSQVYIDNQVIETKDGLLINWDYVEQLFDNHYIENLFDQFINCIYNINEVDSFINISEEDLLCYKCLNDTNNEVVDYQVLHKGIYDSAISFPNDIAIIEGNKSITYKELNKESNKIANTLKIKGIKKGDRVAIIAKKTIKSIVNILAVLKVGAAYVPIDSKYPDERISYIVQDSNCILCLDDNFNSITDLEEDLPLINDINDLAYIIYTSGSTGRPKGVMISHKGAYNTIKDINDKFKVKNGDTALGISSLSFDLSVYDIFGTFFVGATLVLVEDQRNVEDIAEKIQEYNVTIWNSVPMIMEMLIDYYKNNFKNNSLRLVLLSGDYIPVTLPEKIFRINDIVEVISLGGATEGSIWSIYYPINRGDKFEQTVPYGIPLLNQQIYILNYDGEICPSEIEGEIYIGGIGVANGYVNNEKITEESFIKHKDFGIVYKTGDIGILRKSGYIQFAGRKDSQVKLSGYRVEVGEVETVLNSHPLIQKAIVNIESSKEIKRLIAYIKVEQSDNVDMHNEIKEYARKYLPEYMIPKQINIVDDFKLTANGKLDYSNLNIKGSENVEERSKNVDISVNEEVLLAVCREVLEIQEINVTDNFFEIGGDSLKAIKILSLIEEKGYSIELEDFFNNQTIRELGSKMIFKEDNDERNN